MCKRCYIYLHHGGSYTILVFGLFNFVVLYSCYLNVTETVKDLIRFLKRDDDSCAIRRELGEMEILQKDLIPIIKHYSDDRILLETVTR